MRNKHRQPETYKETALGCIVLVTSRDPGTKIRILKDKLKKPKKKQSGSSFIDKWG